MDIDFNLLEWAHDTSGKVLSYMLTLKQNRFEVKIDLDVTQLLDLGIDIQRVLKRDSERLSTRFTKEWSDRDRAFLK